MRYNHFPENQGLYNPEFEKDSCGVGFVCDIKGVKSNQVVKDGITVLNRLAHRGAVGADPKTGDGAGILLQTPHKFFLRIAEKNKIQLPQFGLYGTGMIFLPTKREDREFCRKVFAKVIKQENQILLGWRSVPVDNSVLGKGARQTEPKIEQIFIQRNKNIKEDLDFERRLYVIRKKVERLFLYN